MGIGNEVKKRRSELNLTQDDLAKKLNVARTTISNWETDRNYPDMQTIVLLSDILEISLDQLLKGDSAVIKHITEDTQARKMQSKKIKILYAIIVFLVFFSALIGFKGIEYQDICTSEEIVDIALSDSILKIETDLPSYRSLVSCFANKRSENGIIEIVISSKLDFTMKHKQEIEFPIDSNVYKDIKIVRVVDSKGEAVMSFGV